MDLIEKEDLGHFGLDPKLLDQVQKGQKKTWYNLARFEDEHFKRLSYFTECIRVEEPDLDDYKSGFQRALYRRAQLYLEIGQY